MSDPVTQGQTLAEFKGDHALPGRGPEGGRVYDWLMLVMVLIISAVPMLVVVGRGDTKRTMENITVASAQETWLRQHGWQDIERDPNAWLMPTRNGNPRIVKPPLVIWLDMLAWTGLTPEGSTAQQLLGRARLVSVGMGLMVVVGVFWIGRVLWDRKLAVMAALAAGTCLFLTRQARIASYDIHMTGWATLAVASAIWAMRPFAARPSSAREVTGWCLAGVALAGAFLSKGPLACLVGAAPVLTAIVVVGVRWRRNVIGLMGMLFVAALLTGPWYLYLLDVVNNAGGKLFHEYKAERREFQMPWYYLGLFGLILPWSIWLFAALIQPFVRAIGDERRRLLVAWAWFVMIFVVFSIPGAKQQRYILPIIPAAALLIGQLWRYHQALAERGEVDPGVNLLRVPHWVSLIGVSLAFWPFYTYQRTMLEAGWFERMPVGELPTSIAVPAAGVLIVLAALGAFWHFRWRPMRAMMVTSLWSAVLLTVTWYAWSSGERSVHPVRASAEQVGRQVQGAVLGVLKMKEHPVSPNEEFIFYSRRILAPVRRRDARPFGRSAERVYIAAPQVDGVAALLQQKGYGKVGAFEHDYEETLDLWLFVPKKLHTDKND